jgi:hypothetical protein
MKQLLGFALSMTLLTAPALAGGNGVGGMRTTATLPGMSSPAGQSNFPEPSSFDPASHQSNLKRTAPSVPMADRAGALQNSQTVLWNPCAKRAAIFLGFYATNWFSDCALLNVQGFQSPQTGFFDVLGPNAGHRSVLSTFGAPSDF